MNDIRLYWIWLAEHCGAACGEFGRVIAHRFTPFELYEMSEEELERAGEISERLRRKLGDKRLDDAKEILDYCDRYHVRIVTYADAEYPERLRHIAEPPVLLYVLGKIPAFDERLFIGVVGTRNISEYGTKSTYKISYGLAASGAVVVSGLAKGVDGVAACAALAAKGDTVAVLGCGISTVYPRQHRTLMRAIAKNGTIITEYPPKEPPQRWNFPKRNRIISALSQGVLMAEGAVKSGAMITMDYATAQGREVFAIPGGLEQSNAAGPNELLRRGAKVATCAEDILRHYRSEFDGALLSEEESKKLEEVPAETAFRSYGVSMMYGGVTETAALPDVPEETKKQKEKKPKEKKKVKAKEKAGAEEAEGSVEIRSGRVIADELVFPDENARRVYHALPDDAFFYPDSVRCEGLGTAELLTALTMLEIYGLVSCHAGGRYRKETP